MINFESFAKHLRPNYEWSYVKKNFDYTVNLLGEFNDSDLIVPITIRLKGKSDYVTAKNVSKVIQLKITNKFFNRKGRFSKLPMVASIESNRRHDKDHIHLLAQFRKQDLKQDYSTEQIEHIAKDICRSIREVNSKDTDAVIVRSFPFCETQSNNLGHSIEYICKTSSKHYDPLLKPNNYDKTHSKHLLQQREFN